MACGLATATCASVEGAGDGTDGFQPVMFPVSEAKMKSAGPLSLPEVTTKSLLLL